MTDFERPTCHICNEKIERHESHIVPPFENQIRHMWCVAKCKKCGNANITDLPGHREV